MSKNPISPEEIQQAHRLRATGMSVERIAKILRRSSTGIWYQLKKTQAIAQKVEKQEPSESDQQLIDLFNAGLEDDQIAQEMKIAENTVKHKRSGLGLKRRKFEARECKPGEAITGTRRRMLCEAWI